jgi:DNA-binding NarL/FixJ family response regulator
MMGGSLTSGVLVADLTEARAARTVRVLVVEDEPLVQAAVQTVLEQEPRIDVVGVVESIEGAVELLSLRTADVVLSDLFLRDGTACQLAGRLRRLPAPPPLVVTTNFVSGPAAATCLDAGATLCLDKQTLRSGIAAALLTVAGGRPWRGPGVIRPDRTHTLSYAQAQVLAHVASGMADAAIAERLGYSQAYVKKILVSARTRLGARDRAHAAAVAASIGLVRPTGPGRFSPAVPRRSPWLVGGAEVRELVDTLAPVAAADRRPDLESLL